MFSKAAKGFSSDVTVVKTNGEVDPVNAKSTLSVLTLDSLKNDEIVIAAKSDDADEALAALVELVESGLGE